MSNKKPSTVYWLDNSLYLNITNQCSNNCWFCFRNHKQGIADFNLKLSEEPTIAEIISEMKRYLPYRRWKELVFCGFGEPTMRLDTLLEITCWVKTHFPNTLIRLNTNGHGYSLNEGRDVATELKAAGVKKISVSLNGYNKETYNENCRPHNNDAYTIVLEFIKKAKAAELEVEVTAIRTPEVDIQKVKTVIDEIGVPFRVREYIPSFW